MVVAEGNKRNLVVVVVLMEGNRNVVVVEREQ